MSTNYCGNCGKRLEIEMDFKDHPFGEKVTLIKRCKYCKREIASTTVKKA